MSDSQVAELIDEERLPAPDGVRGTTRIADSVVARIAGMAAREVPGVYDLSEVHLGKAIAGQVQRIAGSDRRDKGVTVQVGQREAIVNLYLIVMYEASIPDVAAQVRRSVSDRIGGMTGLYVKEVNILVTDMRFPTEETTEEEPRVE